MSGPTGALHSSGLRVRGFHSEPSIWDPAAPHIGGLHLEGLHFWGLQAEPMIWNLVSERDGNIGTEATTNAIENRQGSHSMAHEPLIAS